MKLVSWNVNGIRATLNKGLAEFVSAIDADMLCFQETKARQEQVALPPEFSAYHSFWNSAEKPGYSGTAIFTKEKPQEVIYGMNIPQHDSEGRVISAIYQDFILTTVYTPNSQDELRRLPYRMTWDADFTAFLKMLENKYARPVVTCGDFNVSHQEIDLARPKENRMNAGFSDQEREGFQKMLEAGFTDTYRHFYPDKKQAYSWWSYRAGARQKNIGWRLDYFLCSQSLDGRLGGASILPEVMGSDHCPVCLNVNF